MMKRWPGALSSRTSSAGEEEQQRDEQREQLIEQPPRPIAPAAPRRRRSAARSRPPLRPSEGLAERDGDRERPVALLAVERNADIDADRAEARIIADADARRRSASCLKSGIALVVSDPPSKNGTIPKLPPNCFRRMRASSAELGEAAAADRVAVDVLGSELLIAVAAHRPAAARIEAPRRRDVEDAGAEDRARAAPARRPPRCPTPDDRRSRRTARGHR